MKLNPHSRYNYLEQLMMLCNQAGDCSTLGRIDTMSNAEILQTINGYLRKFNCIPFTRREIQKIRLKMND